MKLFLKILLAFFTCSGIGNAIAKKEEMRIVTVGGGATETLAALGGEKYLVGVDTSSMFPLEVKKLPQVGYQRTLAPEGILSLKPTVLIGTSHAGPSATLQHIQRAGVQVMILPSEPTVETVQQRIQEVAQLLHTEEAGAQLWQKVEADLAAAKQAQKNNTVRKKILFLLAVQGKAPLVAGAHTEANTMIELAGGQNVATDFQGYRPLTPEALQELNPEIILITQDGLKALGGREQLWKLPGINHTIAAKKQAVIEMDTGFLLNFGPRTGEAALALAQKINQY